MLWRRFSISNFWQVRILQGFGLVELICGLILSWSNVQISSK